MKIKVTKKYIRENSYKVLKIGYCNLQHLLDYRPAFAYSAGGLGWSCDYYDAGAGVIISTGYAPIGDAVNYELTREYDKRAEEIVHDNGIKWEDKHKALDELLQAFIEEVTK